MNRHNIKVGLFIVALSVAVAFLMSSWIVDRVTTSGTSQQQEARR